MTFSLRRFPDIRDPTSPLGPYPSPSVREGALILCGYYAGYGFDQSTYLRRNAQEDTLTQLDGAYHRLRFILSVR